MRRTSAIFAARYEDDRRGPQRKRREGSYQPLWEAQVAGRVEEIAQKSDTKSANTEPEGKAKLEDRRLGLDRCGGAVGGEPMGNWRRSFFKQRGFHTLNQLD